MITLLVLYHRVLHDRLGIVVYSLKRSDRGVLCSNEAKGGTVLLVETTVVDVYGSDLRGEISSVLYADAVSSTQG